MTDVLIVGAGMAGLCAALELKRRGLSYLVIEAADKPGGRARTRRNPSGTMIDTGAHWLHGEDTPLRIIMDNYGLPYCEDEGGQMFTHEHGRLSAAGDDWLDKTVNWQKAEAIKTGQVQDVPLPDLAVDDEARTVLNDFGRMWNGIDPPWQPSAYEFLTDENTPGGLQPTTGIGSLIDKLAKDAGSENLRFNTPVAQIVTQKDHVLVQSNDNTRFMGRVALFTGSLGVLKSGDVTFDPPLSAEFRRHLSGLVMGRMNKIVVELEPTFFERRGIAADTAFELLDARPPHFCHVRSAGAPIIQLYIAGRQAELIEGMTAREALEYMDKILSPVEMLAGFEAHVVAEPVVSGWVSNPYTRGAYSCCLPGTKRQGPHREARVFFAGDTFDQRFPASLAGAWRSGLAAAGMISTALDVHAGPAVWNETYQV